MWRFHDPTPEQRTCENNMEKRWKKSHDVTKWPTFRSLLRHPVFKNCHAKRSGKTLESRPPAAPSFARLQYQTVESPARRTRFSTFFQPQTSWLTSCPPREPHTGAGSSHRRHGKNPGLSEPERRARETRRKSFPFRSRPGARTI